MKSTQVQLIAIVILVFSSSVVFSAGPILYSPPDDTRFWTGDTPPIFSWSPKFGATAYYLEFDDYNDWNPPLGGFETIETYFDLSEYLTQEDWDPLVFHLFWRVRSVDYWGRYGEPSEAFYFSKTVQNPPSPVSPLDEEFLSPWSSPVLFRWSDYPNPKEYYLEFSDSKDFNTSYGMLTVNSSRFATAPFFSQQDWRYAAFNLAWRVSAMDQQWDRSPWSEGRMFIKLGYRRIMSYGDSITGGYGSSTFDSGFGGYPPILQDKLRRNDSKSSVVAQWYSGGKAEDGAFNIKDSLLTQCGGMLVVMFGSVDIIDPAHCEDEDCRTLQRLGEIVEFCWDNEVIPIICTVIPYNPAGGYDKFPDPSVIQAELDLINQDIRTWCSEDGIAMVDLDQEFRDNAPGGDLSQFYFDWVHPNDMGYYLMAQKICDSVILNW